MRFPVELAPVEPRKVQYSVSAVGSVDAYERVRATARVQGVVERVRFKEGESVASAQVLAEIEPDRFRVAVAAGRASLERAEAQLAEAEASLARREEANQKSPGLLPAEEIEAKRAQVLMARAEVSERRAVLDQAELNLRDAYVRAPMAGLIETRTVETGQYVQPGTTLATLVRRDPLLLRFRVPEADAERLHAGMQARFHVRSHLGPGDGEMTATITHVAQAADAASRMVPVVAEVDRQMRDRARPGAFAEVVVPVSGSADSLVVPEIAIRPSEKGFLAFVVDGDVAHERVLSLGMRTEDGKVEVRSGLSAGELLVVRGNEALRDGAPVRAVEGGRGGRSAGAGAGPGAGSSTQALPGRRGS